MPNSYTLSQLAVGEHAYVVSILSNGRMRRRILDLGLTPNANIECVGRSPSGDPSAYLIRGAVVAIRAVDANNIIVGDQCSEVMTWD